MRRGLENINLDVIWRSIPFTLHDMHVHVWTLTWLTTDRIETSQVVQRYWSHSHWFQLASPVANNAKWDPTFTHLRHFCVPLWVLFWCWASWLSSELSRIPRKIHYDIDQHLNKRKTNIPQTSSVKVTACTCTCDQQHNTLHYCRLVVK